MNCEITALTGAEESRLFGRVGAGKSVSTDLIHSKWRDAHLIPWKCLLHGIGLSMPANLPVTRRSE